MGRPFPLQNCTPSRGRSGLPSNSWFLGPTRVHNPNGISISSAVFVGLTIVTDRQTDHATSVTMGRIYVYVLLLRGLQITTNKQKQLAQKIRPESCAVEAVLEEERKTVYLGKDL